MDQYQSEKYGINIDQGDVVNENPNNNDLVNQQENNNNQSNNNNQMNILPPKKNRTMQYYKFLFYSMKLEIKNTELVNLIRSSNVSEILLWILSIIVVGKFNTIFIILHSLHFIRGVIGLFVLFKMPQSYQIVQGMESEINKEDRENKIFNDYTRKIIDVEIFEKTKPLKNLTLVYLILTLINVFIDLIDFLNSLSKFNGEFEDYIEKISVYVNFIIAVIYIAIDFSYMFWFQTLKYTFPLKYLSPINDAFSGLYNRAKLVFRIGKKETDLKTEEIINNPNRSSNANIQQRDIEMNPINNIHNRIVESNPQSFNENITNLPNQNIGSDYPDNSLNKYPKLDNNEKKGFEENLD